MKKSKPDSGSNFKFGSDFAKVDAHVLTEKDYDEIPKLTDEWFERADLDHGDTLIRRGRPKAESPKISTTLRLDSDVLKRLKASGAGWQSRINTLLRAAVGLQPR